MLIPESGKPADLKLTDIQTIDDCDRALIWLADVLLDMERQVGDRGLDDREWLKKLRAAERNTVNLRHKILAKRDSLSKTSSITEAIARVAIDLLPASAIEALEAQIKIRFPSLGSFNLLALKSEPSP